MDTGNEGSDKNGGAATKSHVCKHEGCGKRFTRLEHLNRHALNHKAGDATCPRCRAHFKRPDLLARHMERHKKRDEETGGNGTLNTRKRAWKADDGSVVPKRPTTQQPSAEPVQDPEHIHQPFTGNPEGPISPPISHQSSEIPSSLQSQEPYQHIDFGLPKDASLGFSDASFDGTNFQLAGNFGDEFCNPSFPPVYQAAQTSTGIPYDEVFQPDTASSFNMPYTTATNYNWLFDLENNLNMGDAELVHPDQQQQLLPPPQPDMHPQEQMVNLDPRIATSSGHTVPSPSQTSRSSQQMSFGSFSTGILSHSQDAVGTNPSPVPSGRSETRSGTNKFTPSSAINPIVELIEPERPLASLYPTTSLPCIDECTRGELLDLIESLRPYSPAEEPVTRDNKLLSLSALQGYLDLFFTRFNTAYPLIHQPTFVASNTEPLYLLSMLLLGATYSEKSAHQLAVCIHDVMRPGIFAHAAFSAEPELWVLKTILLVECFGKSRAGQRQHNMSHLFHGLLINLIRRSDCQTVQPVGPNEADNAADDLEVAWLRWAEAEEKKRLALLCFLWDTQHAVLFCQSLCMSSFELRLPLPSSQALWEARTASEWKSHGANYTPEPQFLTTLKSFLTPSSSRPPHLNSLSRILILHGLMSIYWDMQRRDQTSLGVIPGQNDNGIGTWRDRIARAYDLWKADFDAHCKALSAAHYEPGPASGDLATRDARRELAVFTTSYNAVYHASQVLLNADFLDLQIYAGARHILGRPVQRSDFVRSERVVKQWATMTLQTCALAPQPRPRGMRLPCWLTHPKTWRTSTHWAYSMSPGVCIWPP